MKHQVVLLSFSLVERIEILNIARFHNRIT